MLIKSVIFYNSGVFSICVASRRFFKISKSFFCFCLSAISSAINSITRTRSYTDSIFCYHNVLLNLIYLNVSRCKI